MQLFAAVFTSKTYHSYLDTRCFDAYILCAKHLAMSGNLCSFTTVFSVWLTRRPLFCLLTQPMDNFPTKQEGAEDVGGKPENESAADYVRRMETEENLEKLAGEMQREWKKTDGSEPELSFEKLMKKLKGSDDQ